MTRKICIFFEVIFALLFFSCNRTYTEKYNKLILVDSLLEQNHVDSAKSILAEIKTNTGNEEFIAYYNLISVRLDYMLYKTNIPIKKLAKSLAYYSKHQNIEKMAQVYFYMGAISFDNRDYKLSVRYTKRSEQLANSTNNPALKDKIYKFLSIINLKAGEYQLAMFYARKSFEITKNIGNKPDLVDTYNRLAVAFAHLNQNDSARFYINQCIPLLKYVTDGAKTIYYDNISYLNMDTNPKLSQKFINMALETRPSPDTFDNLAQLCFRHKNYQMADSIWNKVLQTKNIKLKVQVLSSMLRQKQQTGDLKGSIKYATWLINLKDSLAKQRQNEQIKELQMQFDHETELAHQENEKRKLMYLACGCVFLAIIAFLIGRIKILKDKKKIIEKENEILLKEHELLEKQNIIKKYIEHIQTLKKQGKTDVAIIEKLQQKVAKLQEAKDTYSHKGELLYQAAMKGLSIREWNKLEQIAFLSCYASKDIEYSLMLEESGNYTPRQKIFLILQHEGWSDNKIAEMMGLSSGALRTMKSRIKNSNDEKMDME